MGLAFAVWAHQKLSGKPYSLPTLKPYESFADMSQQIRQLLDQVGFPFSLPDQLNNDEHSKSFRPRQR